MAPPMASAIIRDDGSRLLNTAASPVAIVAPTITLRYAREAIGQVRAKNPSMTAAVADIGKVRTDSAVAPNQAKPKYFVPATARQISRTVRNTATGASTRNTNALFMEIIPSLSAQIP